MKNKTRVFLWVGLIFVTLYIWSSHMDSRARLIDAHLLRLGNYLSFRFPDGLPKGMLFIDALHKSADFLKLGAVDPVGNNPLPDFLPQADYHYEKKLNIENTQSPRVVCWTSIRILTEKRYLILYSDWSEEGTCDSSNLPEFK